MDKGGGEETSPIWLGLEDPLHPVVVLGFLRNYDNNVPFLKTKLIFIVRLAIVEGPTSLVPVELVPLEIEIETCDLSGGKLLMRWWWPVLMRETVNSVGGTHPARHRIPVVCRPRVVPSGVARKLIGQRLETLRGLPVEDPLWGLLLRVDLQLAGRQLALW